MRMHSRHSRLEQMAYRVFAVPRTRAFTCVRSARYCCAPCSCFPAFEWCAFPVFAVPSARMALRVMRECVACFENGETRESRMTLGSPVECVCRVRVTIPSDMRTSHCESVRIVSSRCWPDPRTPLSGKPPSLPNPLPVQTPPLSRSFTYSPGVSSGVGDRERTRARRAHITAGHTHDHAIPAYARTPPDLHSLQSGSC